MQTEAKSVRSVRVGRAVRVGVSAACALTLCSGYVVADVAGVLPAPLPHVLQFANIQPIGKLHAGTLHTNVLDVAAQGDQESSLQHMLALHPVEKPIDSNAAQQLLNTLVQVQGLGQYSAIIADSNGKAVAAVSPTAQREPASTLKTLTAFAASRVLDMGSTLDTALWLDKTRSAGSSATLVLTGQGDMLLGTGASDPTHINGRAGLATLTAQAVQALQSRGITNVNLEFDDTLFGSERMAPAVASMQDGRLYAAPLSSMAIDQGKDWTGLSQPSNPDAEGAYAPSQDHSARMVANTVQAQLQQQGIQVQGSPQERTQAFASGEHNEQSEQSEQSEQISVVHSAPLSQLLAFTLQNSDNTEAELFGRLTALATGHPNTIAGDTQAVAQQLEQAGISLAGCHLADTSGLSAGSHISAQTLVQVQAAALAGAQPSVVARALAVSGYSGTVGSRDLGSSVNGQVFAKTGTLNAVSSLTGYVLRNNGGTLTFAVIVNNPEDIEVAIQAINTFVSRLPQL